MRPIICADWDGIGNEIPLFPLDVVLLPGAPLPLHVFEDRYKEMIGECLRDRREFGVVRAHRDGLVTVGCTAKIVALLNRYSDGRMDILCRGERRFEIQFLYNERSFFKAEVELLREEAPHSTTEQRQRCAEMHREMMELSGEPETPIPPLDAGGRISFLLASMIPAGLEFKQQLLQTNSDSTRMEQLREFCQEILPKLRLGKMSSRAATRNRLIM